MSGPTVSAQQPNILFLLTDDQRWDSLGCYGNSIVHTPNLDELSRRSVTFDAAFVTTAICATNRACILTGQYASRHGMWDFDRDMTSEQLAHTYAGLLHQNGYRTGFIGKYGVGNPPGLPVFDFDKGFPGQGNFFLEVDGQRRHLTSVMADQAEEFIDSCTIEATGKSPFCLSISFKAPHVQDSASVKSDQFPFDPRPEIANLYTGFDIPLAPTASNTYFERLPDFLQNSESRSRWAVRYWGPARTQESLKGYYRLISGVDLAIGRILQKLENTGVAENTIVVFTSDHGQFLGEYGLAGKWFPYEPSIRVPLIIYDPRLPSARRGVRSSEIALSIDLAPTMLAWAGIEAPSAMQGRSLLPLLSDESIDNWRDDYFYEHHFQPPAAWNMILPRSEAVRSKKWKYIQYIDSEPVVEQLFDLESDYLETHDLSSSPSHQAVVVQMRERIATLRREFQSLPDENSSR
ncbi:MAG: sulfatase [Planctomycetales bacterium]|nr:sulfatase [Planctomycetales bacterium]